MTRGDVTSRPLLERAKDEDEVQHWLVEQLNARSRGRFHAFREAQIASGNKPDVIVASTSSKAEVAIEVKHGGMDWSTSDLVTALRQQLAEDYLKPDTRRHGVLLITHHRNRRWSSLDGNRRISFSQLMTMLSDIAATLRENEAGSIAVKCFGLNAFKDDSRSTESSSTSQTSNIDAPIRKRSSAKKRSARKRQ